MSDRDTHHHPQAYQCHNCGQIMDENEVGSELPGIGYSDYERLYCTHCRSDVQLVV